MMKKIILILALSLASISHSWGYKFTSDFAAGFYWSSLPVQITVVDSDATRKARLENLSKIAINEWMRGVGTDIWSFYTSDIGASASGRNVVRWSTNFAAETGMSASTTLAAAIRYTSGPYIARTEIVINGSHSMTSDDRYLKTILIHEFGHTVGLDHSEDPNAIMAPSLQLTSNGLNSDDINGMNAVISTTHHYQATGYISPLSKGEESTTSPMSCGSVNLLGSSANIYSLFSGFLMSLVGFLRKRLFK